ncbi:MAG: EAL domain-containing protein [Telluria sp.]|nr:EAL domain-containing protein [Telluria sp.]
MVARELGARLDVRAAQAKNSAELQIRTYAEMLRGVHAQFVLHPQVTRHDFQRMYTALALNTRLTGNPVIGFSPRIKPGERPDFDAAFQRTLASNNLGYPTAYQPAPIGPADSFIVNYVEPIQDNYFGIGKDQGAESIRRATIERARDTGEMQLSGRMRLYLQPEIYPGVIFFMPVYRGGAVPPTLAQRQAEFAGVVFLGVRVDEMLYEVFGPALLEDVDVEIYDLRNSGPGDMGKHNLVFDSGSYSAQPALHARNKRYPLQRSNHLSIAATNWRLQVIALPDFKSTTQRWLPLLAALSAMLLSSLAFFFMSTLERNRHMAEKRAAKAERSLQSKEEQLARISESIDDVLWTADLPGNNTLFASAAIERMFGRPLQAFYDNPQLWTECTHPDDLQPLLAVLEGITRTRTETFEYRIIRPDNEVRWIKLNAHFIPGSAPSAGMIDGLLTDVTEQRRIDQALIRSNRALRAIHACNTVIMQAADEDRLLHGICDVVVGAGYRMAWAGVLQDDADGPIVPIAVAGEHQGYMGCIQDALQLGVRDTGTIGESLRTRMPSVSNRLADDPRLATWRSYALERGYRSKIALPLFEGKQVFGVLNVYGEEENAFDHDEVRLLQGLAERITVAIQSYRDRRARQDAEAGLRVRQRAIEACANPILIASASAPDYPVEYVNPAFEQVIGYGAAEVIGKGMLRLCRADMQQPGMQEIQAAQAQQRAGHAVICEYRKDGTLIWVDVYVSPVLDESGAVTHFVMAMYDITDAKNYEAELEYQSNYDTLTGLANRNLLQDRTNQALARAACDARQVWLVGINLDRFKFVNDTLGREAGDAVLRMVSQRLQKVLRPTDTVARVAGDDFVLVLSEAADENLATSTVRAVMESVAQALTIEGHDYFLTCSAGIAVYPSDGDNAETLVKHADLAMHRAKEMGRNNFQFYTAAMNQRAMDRLRLEGDLRHALQRNELLLHYQPQVDLRTGRIVGAEALLRWQHPQLGMIAPDRFIRIAEESGLIVSIGTWVMRTACLQNTAWHDAGFGPLRIAVNLSGNQFYQADLALSVAMILADTGLAPNYLDIELTEGMVMHDIGQAVEIMRSLKALGVTLSIDDFGTGYSSLSYLKRFPIDVLKIDQSFVRNITTDADEAAIARSIITLAQSLRLRVIAEGVETQEQLGYLRHNRCDEIQGYYFSRPVPASDFETLLKAGKCLPQADADSHQQTLLLIDDQENITASLYRLFRRDGYTVLRAHTAEEALSLLALHDVQVILCDQRMPIMSGAQFLSKVKDLYPHSIRIMLTGHTAVDSIIEAINSGAVFRFHLKPWDDEVLRASVAEAFHYHWHLQGANRVASTV